MRTTTPVLLDYAKHVASITEEPLDQILDKLAFDFDPTIKIDLSDKLDIICRFIGKIGFIDDTKLTARSQNYYGYTQIVFSFKDFEQFMEGLAIILKDNETHPLFHRFDFYDTRNSKNFFTYNCKCSGEKFLNPRIIWRFLPSEIDSIIQDFELLQESVINTKINVIINYLGKISKHPGTIYKKTEKNIITLYHEKYDENHKHLSFSFDIDEIDNVINELQEQERFPKQKQVPEQMQVLEQKQVPELTIEEKIEKIKLLFHTNNNLIPDSLNIKSEIIKEDLDIVFFDFSNENWKKVSKSIELIKSILEEVDIETEDQCTTLGICVEDLDDIITKLSKEQAQVQKEQMQQLQEEQEEVIKKLFQEEVQQEEQKEIIRKLIQDEKQEQVKEQVQEEQKENLIDDKIDILKLSIHQTNKLIPGSINIIHLLEDNKLYLIFMNRDWKKVSKSFDQITSYFEVKPVLERTEIMFNLSDLDNILEDLNIDINSEKSNKIDQIIENVRYICDDRKVGHLIEHGNVMLLFISLEVFNNFKSKMTKELLNMTNDIKSLNKPRKNAKPVWSFKLSQVDRISEEINFIKECVKQERAIVIDM